MVFCTTCRHSAAEKTGPDGKTGGERLVAHMHELLRECGRTDVVVETQACLWNCARPCSVIFRDEERFSFVTGGHAAERAQAEAILAWFDLHGASVTGEVPFRTWPDRMRGHFIARLPPVRR